MGSSIAETQLVSGDIFFQSGMYKKKLNVKTASNNSYSGDIIDLTKYTQGEVWDQVSLVYSIVEVDAKQSEDIRNFTIKPKFLTDNHNTFKFVVQINGKDVNNRAVVCWFAREEIVDIQGEKFATKESHIQNQTGNFNLQYQVDSILSVTSDNGTVSKYNLTNNNQTLNVELTNGNVYAIYKKPYVHRELGKPGSYSPSKTMKINEILWYDNRLGSMPFSGTINLASNVEKPQEWQISSERIYESDRNSSIPINQEYNHKKDADTETKTVITRSVHNRTDGWYPYRQHWTIYCQDYRRTLLRDCIWEGEVTAHTYLYLVNISYIKRYNSPTIANDNEDVWINVAQEELLQTTNTPPKVNSYIGQLKDGNDYYRYMVTKTIAMSTDSVNYYTTYRVYGIKQMKVKISS